MVTIMNKMTEIVGGGYAPSCSINVMGREGIHNLKFDADQVASLAKYLTKHSK